MTDILLFSLPQTISPFLITTQGDTELAQNAQTHASMHSCARTLAPRLKEAKTRDQGSAN